MADVICGTCGHHNSLGANFCSSCGSALRDAQIEHPTMSIPSQEIPSPAHPQSSKSPVAEVGVLLVRRGAKAGSRYILDEEVTSIGRHPESDIFLDDITVSRRHADIRRNGNEYVVTDVGSLNGTYLNRHRVESSPLLDGDLLQIGKFKLMFELGDLREWPE